MSPTLLLLIGGVRAALSASTRESVVLLQVHAGVLSKDAGYDASSFGETVALTEAGYQALAVRRNDTEMRSFILRQLSSMGMEAKDSKLDDLNGFTPWFSGKLAVQSLQSLTTELHKANWVRARKAGLASTASSTHAPAALAGVRQRAGDGAGVALLQAGENVKMPEHAIVAATGQTNATEAQPPAMLITNATAPKASDANSTTPPMELNEELNGTTPKNINETSEMNVTDKAIGANSTTPPLKSNGTTLEGINKTAEANVTDKVKANGANSTTPPVTLNGLNGTTPGDTVKTAEANAAETQVTSKKAQTTFVKIIEEELKPRMAQEMAKGIFSAVKHAGGYLDQLSHDLWHPAALALKNDHALQIEEALSNDTALTTQVKTNEYISTVNRSAAETVNDSAIPTKVNSSNAENVNSTSSVETVKVWGKPESKAAALERIDRQTKDASRPASSNVSQLLTERRANATQVLRERKKAAEQLQRARKKEHALMKAAIKRARSLPLTQAGYKAMLVDNSSAAARTFIRRVAEAQGLRIMKPDTFESMLRFYGGGCGAGSYNALIAELHSASQPSACSDVWIEKLEKVSADRAQTDTLIDRWAGMAERVPTWRWSYRASKHPLSLLAQAVSRTSTWHHAESMSAPKGLESLVGRVASVLNPSAHLGLSAELSAEGYEAVANVASEVEMAAFVRRAAAQEGLTITDEQALKDMLPFYDGECDTQSYETLVNDIWNGEKVPASCGGSWVK